jgi:polygalacturonase
MIKKSYFYLAIFFLCITASTVSVFAGSTDDEMKKYLKDIPFDIEIKVPKFRDANYLITEYGAVGDGITLNSEAIQKAIDKCNIGGGGHVIIPAGLWLTGPIQLRNDVDLHFETGAVLVFSTNFDLYQAIQVPGKKPVGLKSPISCSELQNIAITGDGIINGNGQYWRPVKQSKMTPSQWKALIKGGVQNGDVWYPSADMKEIKRPKMVNISECENILIEGITFQNSPDFALNVTRCENIVVRYAKVMNEWSAQNGDGLDFSSCENLLIYKCTVNAGDDGICIKSTKNIMKNVVVQDCIVYHAHGGFVIGSNTDGGIENLFVKNCTFSWSDIGLRFKSASDRGGLIKNVYVSDIFMKDISGDAISFDCTYENRVAGADADKKDAVKIPTFTNFHMKNIFCDGAERAFVIDGTPEAKINEIYLDNAVLSANKGFESNYGSAVKLSDVKILTKKSPVFSLTNTNDCTFKNITFTEGVDLLIKAGENVKGITVEGADAAKAKNKLEALSPDGIVIK